MRSSKYVHSRFPETFEISEDPENPKKASRTPRVARLSASGVLVRAYIAGNRPKKSDIESSVMPFRSLSSPSWIDSLLFWEWEWEKARVWRMSSGMEPLRWAWSSALGRERIKVSWEGVSDARAAAAGPAMGVIVLLGVVTSEGERE